MEDGFFLTPPDGGCDGGGRVCGRRRLASPPPPGTTAAQYIAIGTIMNPYLSAKRRPGPRVATQWWEQEGLGFGGMWKAAREAEQTEGAEETDTDV